MSKVKALADEAKAAVGTGVGEAIKKNGNLFTGFVALVILVAGVGIVNGRETWWISAAAITFAFLLLFFYLNARVLIKAVVSGLIAVFLANFALQGGVIFDPTSSVGLVWMTAQIFLFFALIATSYLMTGHRSRWTGAALSCASALMAAAALSELLPMLGAIGASMGVGFLTFFAYYRLSGKLMEHSRLMPTHEVSEAIEEAVYAQAEREGWEVRRLASRSLLRRTETVDYLVWNGTHAYVLHPVRLASKFSISPGRRATKLVHRGASINPWLLNLVSKRLPLWRARNAPMMLVLLDVASTNGVRPETIGVSIPDSPRKIPVGIYPAKGMLTASKKSKGALADMDRTYGDFLKPLTERQIEAMGEIGLRGNSEYLTPTDAPPVEA